MSDTVITVIVGLVSSILGFLGALTKMRIDRKKITADAKGGDRMNTREDYRAIYEQMEKTIARQDERLDKQGDMIDKQGKMINELESALDQERKERKAQEEVYTQRMEELNSRYLAEVEKTRQLQEAIDKKGYL